MAKWFCLTQVARRIHFGSFPLIGRFVTSVTSTFGRSRYSVGVDLSGIPIPPTPAARKDNRKTLRVLHHSEGLLLLGDHKQKPSAEDAGSFLTRGRSSCARKERAPMNSDLNLRAERQTGGSRNGGRCCGFITLERRLDVGAQFALAASLFTREISIWLSGGLGTGVRSASLSDKGRVPLTSALLGSKASRRVHALPQSAVSAEGRLLPNWWSKTRRVELRDVVRRRRASSHLAACRYDATSAARAAAGGSIARQKALHCGPSGWGNRCLNHSGTRRCHRSSRPTAGSLPS
jgi:hypothetical protein